ncbi:MAG: NADH-quinone oxidoreductase subunit J [Verrucomicrobiota bacterium]
MSAFFFWLLAVLSIICGGAVILHRNPVACALALAGLSLALAALFVTLEAFFLAASQVIVYTGAVVVLFLFMIMLTHIQNSKEESIPRFRLFAGVIIVVLLCLMIGCVLAHFFQGDAILIWQEASYAKSVSLGQSLFANYALPFLASAVLLLTATIGAIFLGKKDEPSH